ncbi:MAG: hypothetical protein IJM30_06080 [Thermoguttaceae bacterium]|nr:hypothetical protein [Thermoguttaceae bacterium]
MNLVGKIFVGLIALMSVVVLTTSVISYASHKNWKTKADELQKQLTDANNEKTKLEAQKKELAQKIDEGRESYTKMVEATMTKVAEMQDENSKLKDVNEKLEQDLDRANQTVTANTEYIRDIHAKYDVTSDELKKAQGLRASYLRDLAETMEKLHDLSTKYGDLQSEQEELTGAYDEALEVLNQHGLSANPGDYSELPKVPVAGTISTVTNDGLVSISIGSDDGLREHNRLDVKRDDSYLGKIEVVVVEPNRAVCKILPEYRQGLMQGGDRVYSQAN